MSQRFPSEQIYSTERREIGIESQSEILRKARGTTLKIRERKGPLRGDIHKCEHHERNPCAPRFEESSQDEALQQERCARRAAWDLAKSVYKLKNTDKYTLYSPIEARTMPAPPSKIPRGTRIRGGLRSINAHAEQKGFDLRRTGDSAEIQDPQPW